MKRCNGMLFLLLLLVGLLSGCRSGPTEPGQTFVPPSGYTRDPLVTKKALEYSYEYVHAKMIQGSLTLTFRSTPALEGRFPSQDLQFDQAYPVSGFDNNYQDLFIGTMGQDVYPYLFLLTDDGTVEYMDVPACIEAGLMFQRSKAIPSSDLANIVSFENGTVSSEYGAYTTVFAVDAKGDKHDLSFFLVADPPTEPSFGMLSYHRFMTFTTSTGAAYQTRYELTFWDDGSMLLTEDAVGVMTIQQFEGTYTIEEGSFSTEALCSYTLTGGTPGFSEKPETSTGTFSTKSLGTESIEITCITGRPFSEIGLGQPAAFTDSLNYCPYAGEWAYYAKYDENDFIYLLTIGENWEVRYGSGFWRSEFVESYQGLAAPIEKERSGRLLCMYTLTDTMADPSQPHIPGTFRLGWVEGDHTKLAVAGMKGLFLASPELGTDVVFTPYNPAYDPNA